MTRNSNDERGATMLEFAITSGLFLILLVATMQAAIYCFRTLSLQFVAADTVRWAIVGVRSVNDVEDFAINRARDLRLNIARRDVLVCPGNDFRLDLGQCCPDINFVGGSCSVITEGVGVPGGFVAVMIRVDSPFVVFGRSAGAHGPLVIPEMRMTILHIVAAAAGRNEFN